MRVLFHFTVRPQPRGGLAVEATFPVAGWCSGQELPRRIRGGSTDPAEHYQYFWWIDVERPGRYYALGNFGQYLYVAPDAGTVIVRNGRDWGVENETWLSVFRDLADQLVRRS